jgi:O-antigen/teichoic acid export membrane protein
MAAVNDEPARDAREARDATRGSAIKLAAELASRLLGLATTLLLIRGLGASEFGAFGRLSLIALLLGELGELGLQILASRALVAGTLSLRALVRARLVLAAGLGGAALASLGRAPVLAPLVLWFALSGWGEFLGVALRCRGARVAEALLLLCLRGLGLVAAAIALSSTHGLAALAWALSLSTLPALALGAWMLRRFPPAHSGGDAGVASVLREAFPLAVHAGLLLLSPRVEFLVLSLLRGDRETGLFLAGLRVYEFLTMVPAAVAAGAMPGLTREALRGGGSVRERTAWTLAFLGAPAAVGLALVADPLAQLLLGPGYEPADYAGTAVPLRLLALALPALFVNGLLQNTLVAAGRTRWLPRITALRVGFAFAMAVPLVQAAGGTGAAIGTGLSEWLLLVISGRACAAAGAAVPILRPLAYALAAALPMALAVAGLRQRLLLAVAVGVLVQLLVMLALAWLLARHESAGDLRYPWNLPGR